MADPFVSWLLPARDAEATLREALEGVLAQRGAPPFEVVCVDDGSRDGTAALLAEAARRDARVRVVRGEGKGLVAALLLGLRHCRGQLIARMDADDRVHPDRLRLQAELLARKPALGAVGSMVRCFPWPLTAGLFRLQEWLDATVSEEQCALGRFVEAPLVHPATTFRRSALEAAGSYRDAGWPEDWDLLLRLFEAGHALANAPQVLLWWRDSPRRLTRIGTAYSREALRELRAHFLARGPLRGRPCEIWGAGPTGKRLARALEPHGVHVRRFVDVSPHKREARGVPVVPAAQLGPRGEALLLVAVTAPGARETIRAALRQLRWREGLDWIFAA
jgi:glycosyltransferase involved in cell wall biosynthesis